MLTRRTHLAGVIGWPLEHTLSPAIHNAAFRRLGLDWTYLAFPLPPEALRPAIEGLRALAVAGVNVTMPHKETVVDLLDDLAPDAEAIGAVNTIEYAAGRLVGHNTDAEGFRTFLELDAGVHPGPDSNALILGAGGAARAVVRALGDMGVRTVTVAAREPNRAAGLSDISDVEITDWRHADELAASQAIIVNCTPVGMDGEDVLPAASFSPGQVVVDLIYRPPTTRLLERARAAGADGWGGIGMLVHQAAAAFRIWTGQEPPVEVMSAAAIHAIRGGFLHGDN